MTVKCVDPENPCVSAKEPYVSAKEPHSVAVSTMCRKWVHRLRITAQEVYESAKKPIFCVNLRLGTLSMDDDENFTSRNALYICKRALCIRKRAPYIHKKALCICK